MRGLRSRKPIGFRQWVVHFSAYDTKSKYEKTGEIGRDTEAVLGEVGYTKEQVEALRSQGAAK